MSGSSKQDDYYEQAARKRIEAYRPILDDQDRMLTLQQAAALLLSVSPDHVSLRLAEIDGQFRELMRDLRDDLINDTSDASQPWKYRKVRIDAVVGWGRINEQGRVDLINDLLGPFPEADSALPSVVLPQDFPPLLKLTIAARLKFWSDYDPERPQTIPKKENQVMPWLTDQGVSSRIANAIDTIIREPATKHGGNRRLKGDTQKKPS